MQSPGQSQSVSDRARQYAAPRRNGSGANWNRAGGGAGNYNLNGQNHGGNIIIDRIPDLHRNMDHRGFDGGRGDLMWNGYRVGYHHYDGGWRDNDFFFGFYAYQPWDSCVVSPWYWYPFLPPYINRSHVIILHDDSVSQQWYGDVYDYSYNGGDRIGLDDAVNDIVDSFERDDQRAMDRVVPHSGRIAIYVDGQYSYSMTADDFYNMFKDNVENSKTNRYRIVDVRYDHRDTAKVVAEHDYTDPWGQEATTYNTYYLVRGAEGWVIRDFGTGNVRD